ncbi:MAG: hypothetical protein COA57_07665 [Flavobacteriales bacterium]|nr:MAG: hypothetical protein COA57_07665 [Flavobacteriales bacterium]
MKKHAKYFVAFSLLLTAFSALGQQNFTLYTMPYVQQRIQSNPALVPKAKIHIGLPLISSIYMSYGNSGFKYSDLVFKGSDDSLHLDFENMISKLKKKNYISGSFQLDLLTFGMMLKDQHYVNLNVSERFLGRARYPKDFFEFAWYGNYPTIGETLNFNFGLDVVHYREFGIGYAHVTDESKWKIGGKFKYINAIGGFETEKFDILLHTDPDDVFTFTASGDIEINVAGFEEREVEFIDDNGDTQTDTIFAPSFGNYPFSFYKNHGMGIDIGAEYNVMDKLHVNASIIDMGFIRWKDKVHNFKSVTPGKEFKYRGLPLNEYLKDGDSTFYDGMDALTDSLAKTFEVAVTNEPYTTKLSSQYHLGVTYDLSSDQQVGGHFYWHFFDGRWFPGASLYYDKEFGDWCTIAVSYTLYNRSWSNIGLGARINGGPVQFYIVSDNIIAPFFPEDTKYSNLRVGINITLGNPNKKKEKAEAPRIE